MRLLLDTNVLVAIINDMIDTLPASLIERLAGADTHYASVASLWELAIKSRLGKLDLKMDLEDIPAQLRIGRVELIDLAAEHVLAEALPVPPTRDPFDRVLLAVAQVEHLSLLTTDSALRNHPLAWSPNRA